MTADDVVISNDALWRRPLAAIGNTSGSKAIYANIVISLLVKKQQ